MLLHTLQSEFAENLLSGEVTLDVILHPLHMQIYRRNRFIHLTRALHHLYPLIYRLVGDNFFQLLARDYINYYPSCSSNLYDYGEYFDRFIEMRSDTASLPYLPEVARFEWLCHHAYFAPEAEGLSPAALEAIPSNAYDKLHFMLHPACHVYDFHYPILQIIALCKGEIDDTIHLEEGGIHLLIIRRQLELQLVPLAPAEYALLSGLQANLALSTTLSQALAIDPTFKLEEKLPLWIQNKTIVDFAIS